MAKRTDIKSILIIGAGPIVIGQACEFDYSGAQACKALREEGYRVILVNSNPATIMTDPEMADATYIEPITPETVARILEKERPDALLPTMGGQTALNCALGSVVATIGLTVPAISFFCLLTGHDIVFGLEKRDTMMLLLTLMISIVSFGAGRTNVLTGLVHLVVFAAYVFFIFVP